jgi:phosphoribosylformimino-5-aminoimidazole carboxamide ribotide isomerase
MEILPAIDLRGGKCVRLIQGDYGRETVFGDDPVAIARHWEEQGATRLHVVDLEGAKEGHPCQLDTVAAIAHGVSIPVEMGGGIRTVRIAREVLAAGLERVILGSAALEPAVAAEFASALPGRVVGGIDARDGLVAVRGWLDTTQVRAVDLARELVALGLEWIVYTDIGRDGMLRGANVEAMQSMVEAVPQAKVIASGGVTTVGDIRALRKAGAAAAIVGMALYTGKLKLEDALRAAME